MVENEIKGEILVARNGKKNKTTQEPWEKSIYETDYEPVASRTAQRKVKKGNALFMKLLVFLIVVIVSGPIIFFVYVQQTRHNTPANTAQTTQTDQTTDETQTQETTTDTTDTDNTDTTETTTDENAGDGQEGEDNQDEDGATTGQQFATVQAGEGINALADRTGVPAETIARLNPEIFDAQGNFLPGVVWNAGQEVRIQ